MYVMSGGGYHESICELRARSLESETENEEQGLICRVRSLKGESVGKLCRDGEVSCAEADTASSEKGMMNAITDTSKSSKEGKLSPVLDLYFKSSYKAYEVQ